MIDWKNITSHGDLTPDVCEAIRGDLLTALHAKGAREYALGLVVLLLGVNSKNMEDLYIHFIPTLQGEGSWILVYQGKPLALVPSIRDAMSEYLREDPRFSGYLAGYIPEGGAVLPLFLSTSRQTMNKPLKYTYFIFRDALMDIGYDTDQRWLRLCDLQAIRA